MLCRYNIQPMCDINFGSMMLNSKKARTFVIENKGERFEFKYAITKMVKEVPTTTTNARTNRLMTPQVILWPTTPTKPCIRTVFLNLSCPNAPFGIISTLSTPPWSCFTIGVNGKRQFFNAPLWGIRILLRNTALGYEWHSSIWA